MSDQDDCMYIDKNRYKVKKRQEFDEYEENNLLFNYGQTEEPVSDSQNFCLRLSDGTNISESDIVQEKAEENKKNEIVVISDSSFTFSPKHSFVQKPKCQTNFSENNKVYILDSSESESSDEDENENFFQAWKAKRKLGQVKYTPENVRNENTTRKKNTFYTSDESSSDSEKSNKKYAIDNSAHTNSTHVSATPQIVEHAAKNVHKIIPQVCNTDQIQLSSSQSSSTSNSTLSSRANKALISSNYRYKNTGSNKLTQQDTRNILKNIKSTQAVYEYVEVQKESNIIINETLDDDDIHPAISSKDKLYTKNGIIDETAIDSESDDIVQDTQLKVTNPNKTHVSRFLDVPDVEKACTELSERKKKQISQWLMTNSPDSRSDSSFSHITASNRNSISSGNSSLERLEMNYETPNNRGKIPKVQTNEHSNVSRQKTLHEFIEKSKDDKLVLRTPKAPNTNRNQSSTLTANTPENVDIMGCADILDKLYGNIWREKADVLLPASEPRSKAISTQNRAVQTERKAIRREKHCKTNSENDSETSFEDLKLKPRSNRDQVKRSVKVNGRMKDSFINDESSSESGSDSLYYTALTNPRISTNNAVSKPIPTSAQRIIAICDTDSEDENDKDRNDHMTDIRRRRLSFSNDENEENSDTSEFDPGDHVPPKYVYKKGPKETPREKSRTNKKTELSSSDNQKHNTYRSFLASLSESVPIDNAHPNAKKYRKDFKNNKEDLCKYLYKLYNEKVFDKKLPEDMSIEWNVRMRGTAGFCYNKKSVKTLGGIVKSSRIVLSTKVLDTADRLRDTLIHEMCHAAAWLINDVSDGHGPFWTGWANKAMKTFPDLPPIRRCHDYKIKTKFTYKCTGCGYSIGRHSKSLDIEKKRCGHCYGKFELLINKTTKSGTVQMQTPKREPSAFALYVKEHYSTVKKERNIKHAEVMRILGQQFSAIKIAKKNEYTCDDPGSPG